MSVEIQKTEDVIITSTENVSVGLKSAEDVQGNSEVVVEAKLKKWTVLGDDIYIANQTEALPLWFQTTLDAFISNDSTLSTGLDVLQTNFNNFETGYNSTIGTINSNIDTLTFDLTTLTSNYNDNYAAILNLQTTKATKDEASAEAVTVLGAWTADPLGTGASFTTIMNTQAGKNSAFAEDIESLDVTYNGTTARINSIEYVEVDAQGYKAGSSKFITAPDGGITGWEFTDSAYTPSDMTIYADNFYIRNSTASGRPFSISGSNVKFDGVVDFTNTNGSGTTTLDGGKITTNTLLADRIKSRGTNVGFDLDGRTDGSQNAGGVAGANIYGANIYGSTIVGANLNVESTTPGNLAEYTYKTILSHKDGASTLVNNGSSFTRYSSSTRLYSPSYGSGYLRNRVADLNNSILTIVSIGGNSESYDPLVYFIHQITIQFSVDGAAYYDAPALFSPANTFYTGSLPNFTNYLDIRMKIKFTNEADININWTPFGALQIDLVNT